MRAKNKLRLSLLAIILLTTPFLFNAEGGVQLGTYEVTSNIGTCCHLWNSLCIVEEIVVYNHYGIEPGSPCVIIWF